MREILFRGKRIDNGEWVYGSYVEQYGAHEIYLTDGVDSEYGFDRYHVDPSTVGQYTGMTDQNGKKMFENDIVLCTEPLGMGYREIRGKVAYKLTGFVVDCGKFNTTLSGGLTQSPYYVVGNIHDNPELLDA